MSENPTRLSMLQRNFLQKLNGFATVKPRQLNKRQTKLSHQTEESIDAMPLDDDCLRVQDLRRLIIEVSDYA